MGAAHSTTVRKGGSFLETQETAKKTKHAKINYALVGRIMRHHWLHLVVSVIALVAAVAFAYIVPMITSFTVDYVIGTEPSAEDEDSEMLRCCNQ